MTIYAAPGSQFTPYVSNAPTASTIGLAIYNPATSSYYVSRFTAGIVETPAGSGIYYAPAQTAPTVEGTYQLIWDSPSSPPDAVEDLIVSYSLPNNIDLCTVADVTLAAGIPAGRAGLVQDCISAASSAIANRYQREFVDSGIGATRRFELDGPRVSLAPYDLQSFSAIALNPETTSPVTLAENAGIILRPVGKSMAGTYTSLEISGLQTIISSTTIRWGVAFIDVTGVWGMPSIPDDVRRAAIITAAAWTDRAAAVYGLDSDGSPGQNTAAFAQTWGIPTAAHRLLQPYERMEYA